MINGKIAGLKSHSVILQKYDEGKMVTIDSATVDTSKGTFVLKGKLACPDLLYLVVNPGRGRGLPLFVENSKMTLTASVDSLDKYVATGSKSQDEFKEYRDKMTEVMKQGNKLGMEYQAAKSAGKTDQMKVIENASDKLEADVKDYCLHFVKTNTKSFVAPYILMSQLSYDMEAGQMDSLLKGFDTTLVKSTYVKMLNEKLELLKKTAIGQPAPDFTMNDTLGKPVQLSSLFGKYMLIDFWASWCRPCREENPNVVEAYKQYSKKGFTILGVSLDRDKSSWEKAIKDDHLTWHHVSDLQFWNNAAAKLYGIQAIPSNILLDPKGVIIGRNLRGQALKDKLKELLK